MSTGAVSTAAPVQQIPSYISVQSAIYSRLRRRVLYLDYENPSVVISEKNADLKGRKPRSAFENLFE